MELWWIFGILLLIVAGILFFVQRSQRQRATSLKSARSVTVADLQNLATEIASEIGGGHWRDFIKLNGMIRCDRPLVSELKQEPCVHYAMSVTREYEATITRQDSDGKSYQDTDRGSETLSRNQRSRPFYLEDSTGRIEINPDGAKIDTIKVLEDFRPEAAGGVITYGGFSRVLEADRSDRRTLGYRYRESVLPVDQRATVVGMVSDHSGHLRVQKPAKSEHQFIISLKDEETLTQAADSGANSAFYGMIACLSLGSLFILIGLLT